MTVREQVLSDAEELAASAAAVVASFARDAVCTRGLFTVALSGGSTPWKMLRLLSEEDVPWSRVHIFQVDERVAPPAHAARNQTLLLASLVDRLPIAPAHVHWMPVDRPDLVEAAAWYADEMKSITGRLDLVQLGLGDDGHTASLVPGDPVVEETERDVAVTEAYRGFRRMTLTAPPISRARQILWIVSGVGKGLALARLRGADPGIPAGRIHRERALLLCDTAAYEASRLAESGTGDDEITVRR